MTSKYDPFWREMMDQIIAALRSARDEQQATSFDVRALRSYGGRQNWSGKLIISASGIENVSGQHLRALGQLLLSRDVCRHLGDALVRLTVSSALILRVEPSSGHIPSPVSGGLECATEACFRAAFADTTMASPPYRRLLEVMLSSATAIPDDLRRELTSAIRDMSDRPHIAISVCGRHVLDDLLRALYAAVDEPWVRGNTSLYERIESLEPAFRRGRLPVAYQTHLQRLRYAGNPASHDRDRVTPTLAFLTVAETIYFAEEVMRIRGP